LDGVFANLMNDKGNADMNFMSLMQEMSDNRMKIRRISVEQNALKHRQEGLQQFILDKFDAKVHSEISQMHSIKEMSDNRKTLIALDNESATLKQRQQEIQDLLLDKFDQHVFHKKFEDKPRAPAPKVEQKTEENQIENLKIQIMRLESMIEAAHAPPNSFPLVTTPMTPNYARPSKFKFQESCNPHGDQPPSTSPFLETEDSARSTFRIEHGTLPKSISEFESSKKRKKISKKYISKKFSDHDVHHWEFAINFREPWQTWNVTAVQPGSQADVLGVETGWKLKGLDGQEIGEMNYKEIMAKLISGKGCRIMFQSPKCDGYE
jgi:hypothetical protein